MNFDDLVQSIIIGICGGIGSTIGSFIAIKYFVEHMDKIPTIKEKIKEIINNGRNKHNTIQRNKRTEMQHMRKKKKTPRTKEHK